MSFQLVSDVQQTLNKKLFGPGWTILGIAKQPGSNISRERYFFLLLNVATTQSYIEEYVDFPEYFNKVTDDVMWNDLYRFFADKGLVSMGIGKEKKVASKG